MADEQAEADDEMNDRMDRDLAILKSHAVQLSEHFDSVQIFCSRAHADGTIGVDRGEGNWFARYGQVKEWVKKEDAKSAKTATEDE